MVVADVTTVDRKPNLFFDLIDVQGRHYVVESKVNPSEWREAVETVLPNLLGHNRTLNKSIFLDTDTEYNYLKKYIEAIYDFGRWISNIGSSFMPGKAQTTKMKSKVLCLTAGRMKEFFNLLENHQIKSFLEGDRCKIYADSYLLAMVFVYFLRADFTIREYNTRNFFIALVLAHEMEEENYAVELLVLEFETAAILQDFNEFVPMHRLRYELFIRMNYRALVSRKCCEEIMSICPDHWAWKRKRHEVHSGVYQPRRYPSNHFSEYRYTDWKPAHFMYFKECEPCLRAEKRNAEIVSKIETRGTGKRLSLQKRKLLHSNNTEEKDQLKLSEKRFLF